MQCVNKVIFLIWFVLMGSVLAPPAYAERVALVIGNAEYQSEKPLKNPVNDARLIDGILRNDLKFDVVIKVENGSLDQIDDAVEKFVREARGADAAVFYFSGHGMQDDGKHNYLIPVDAALRTSTTSNANPWLPTTSCKSWLMHSPGSV